LRESRWVWAVRLQLFERRDAFFYVSLSNDPEMGCEESSFPPSSLPFHSFPTLSILSNGYPAESCGIPSFLVPDKKKWLIQRQEEMGSTFVECSIFLVRGHQLLVDGQDVVSMLDPGWLRRGCFPKAQTWCPVRHDSPHQYHRVSLWETMLPL